MNDCLSWLDTADELLGSLPSRERIANSPRLFTSRTFKIRVDRTIPFEFIANLIPSFCRLWAADVKFDLSDYDAALSQLGGDFQADAYVIWLDWRIYRKSMSPQEATDWLAERIQLLRGKTDKPIWVNNWPEPHNDGDMLFGFRTSDRAWVRKLNVCILNQIEKIPGCELLDIALLAYERVRSFFDDRNEQIASYPFSDQATISIARHLGVHQFPAALAPRLKSIALDLDDTLYSGVLGEDGCEGVVLSEGHELLQKLLLRLKCSGILLTICSRNEEEDVKALFVKRDDFPLKWNDFAAVCANWRPKTENMHRLAQQLNIDLSAFLFIDDNPAELLKMANVLPSVHLLRADRNGGLTMSKLCHYPGLYQLYPDGEASSRTADVQANQKREKIREGALDFETYLASLQMVIRVDLNQPAHAGRLYDLSRKTNQFNLALARLTQSEALEVMNPEQFLTMTVSLSDLLADSGIIGAFVCRLEGRKARLIETIFSCRALGREVETVAFACLLGELLARKIDEISIDVIKGPRNDPAINWLKRLVQHSEFDNLPISNLLSVVQRACKKHPAVVEVME